MESHRFVDRWKATGASALMLVWLADVGVHAPKRREGERHADVGADAPKRREGGRHADVGVDVPRGKERACCMPKRLQEAMQLGW